MESADGPSPPIAVPVSHLCATQGAPADLWCSSPVLLLTPTRGSKARRQGGTRALVTVSQVYRVERRDLPVWACGTVVPRIPPGRLTSERSSSPSAEGFLARQLSECVSEWRRWLAGNARMRASSRFGLLSEVPLRVGSSPVSPAFAPHGQSAGDGD